MEILPLFCDIDDFCQLFEPARRRRMLASGALRRHKPGSLSLREVMTILVLFHASGYRDPKGFYTRHVAEQLGGEFPHLVSYGRFVELQREALVPLWCYLQTRTGHCTGIAFVDATTLAVCHNLRIPQHRVFGDSARGGQSSMGWFYGFKLHLAINDRGELLSCYLTPGSSMMWETASRTFCSSPTSTRFRCWRSGSALGVSRVRSLWRPEEPTLPPFCFVILAIPNAMPNYFPFPAEKFPKV